ncbi:hypothetical protein ACFX1R_020235 [Malus domestica]
MEEAQRALRRGIKVRRHSRKRGLGAGEGSCLWAARRDAGKREIRRLPWAARGQREEISARGENGRRRNEKPTAQKATLGSVGTKATDHLLSV